MAIVSSGLLGKISGKVGDYIYFITKDGRQAVRKASKRTSKEPTQAQLAQRARFSTVVLFLRNFKTLFPILPKTVAKHSCHARTARQIFAKAIIGEYPEYRIDYSKVSFGQVLSFSDLPFSVESEGTKLSFQWSFLPTMCNFSRVIMIAFSPASGQLVFDAEHLHGNSCTLEHQGNLHSEQVETWLVFANWDDKHIGYCAYCGSVEVISSK